MVERALTQQTKKPVAIGLILALVTLAVWTFFPRQMVIELAAVSLAVIAAVYIGFALSDGREPVKRGETGTAILFIVISLAGLWITPWFLVLGYIGHGIWDWLHHTKHLQTDLVGWYPPFCAVYDLIVGTGIIFWIA